MKSKLARQSRQANVAADGDGQGETGTPRAATAALAAGPRPFLRVFLTASAPCPFGCAYCFAKFPEYEHQVSLESVLDRPADISEFDLVYPACDTDFFVLKDWDRLLPRLEGPDCTASWDLSDLYGLEVWLNLFFCGRNRLSC